MNNELMQYTKGEKTATSRHDRQMAKRAQRTVDDVQLAGMQIDGALALGGHIMEGVVALDAHRRALAKDDVGLNLLLAEIEETTVQQVRARQRSLHNSWGI